MDKLASETQELTPAMDPTAPLSERFVHCRPRLRQVVQSRLDPRLQRRVDPSDVLQESYVEAMARFAKYDTAPSMSFWGWLRFLTEQKLRQLHRQHLVVGARDVRREQQPSRLPFSSAAQLATRASSPSQTAIRAEIRQQVQDMLNRLETMDREILQLRHFEQLSNSQVALRLGISESAASKRYVRALNRAKAMLHEVAAGAPLREDHGG